MKTITNSLLRLLILLYFILIPIAIQSKTPFEAGRDILIKYGVNPSYDELSSVKCPYGYETEDDKKGTGLFINLPNGRTYEVTYGDEKFIQRVVARRKLIREEFQRMNYPVSIDGAGLVFQYAFLDDSTATCVYFYTCDETIHDMNKKMLEEGLFKIYIKNLLKKDPSLQKFISAFVNLKYVYIGNSTGLTSYITFGLDELLKYAEENEE